MFRDLWHRPKISGKIVVKFLPTSVIGASLRVCLAVFWKIKDWVANPASLRQELNGYLVVGGSILGRHWAIRSLGRFHRIHNEIRNAYALNSTSAYGYVRNRYYLVNIFQAGGLSQLAGSRMAVAMAPGVYRSLLMRRKIRAEAALSRKSGELFAQYNHEVSTIIPTRLHVTELSAPIARFTEPPAETAGKP